MSHCTQHNLDEPLVLDGPLEPPAREPTTQRKIYGPLEPATRELTEQQLLSTQANKTTTTTTITIFKTQGESESGKKPRHDNASNQTRAANATLTTVDRSKTVVQNCIGRPGCHYPKRGVKRAAAWRNPTLDGAT